MAQGLKPPQKLNLTGNLQEEYLNWIGQYEIYAVATGVSEKAETVQCSVFLHVAGPEAQAVAKTFTFTNEEKDKIAPLKAKMKAHCEGVQNVTVTRYRFNTTNQQDGQKFDSWFIDLQHKIASCKYGDLKDSMMIDRIVCGIKDDTVREKLLHTADLTLAKCLDICRVSEINVKDLKVENIDVKAISKQFRSFKNARGATSRQRPSQVPAKTKSSGESSKCKCCGQTHEKFKCPAYRAICAKCNKKGHFADQCYSKKFKGKRNSKNLHEIDQDEESSEDEFFLGSIGIDCDVQVISNEPWLETINGIVYKLDTGSQVNTLPRKLVPGKCKVTPTSVVLRVYGGEKIVPEGKTELNVRGQRLTFQIVNRGEAILGKEACELLGLIKRTHIQDIETVKPQNVKSDKCKSTYNNMKELAEEFKEVFSGLGCIESDYKLVLDKSVPPTVDPPRRIPHSLHEKVKDELRRMEELNVIVKENEPTPWVNSMTVVSKPNGKVRICIDPTKLNQAVKRAHYPTKTVEEVAANMPDAKYFSTFDANSGYWQISLDTASSKMCTFQTPWGRYRFKRLPFGVTTSGDAFNQVMTALFGDLEGVSIIVDDILIHGRNVQEHDERVKMFLERAREVGLTLNKDKSKFRQQEVSYCGHILSADGLKPSPDHIDPIMKMETPTKKDEVRRFLALVGYLHKFMPDLSEKSKPLRQLLEKDVEFHWEKQHEDSFQQVKQDVTKAPVLKLFDARKPVTLQVDSSKYGLGAALLQDGQPVLYASRSLDKTQQNYAVIERELLAICFATQKFHQYVYGKTIYVETDHKPLLGILAKPMHTITARMQRMRLRLQRYDLKVSHKPGKEMFIADTLSRAPIKVKADQLFDESLEINVINATQEKLCELQEATEEDETLQVLKKFTMEGWPESSKIPPEVKPYFSYRDEISEENGLLMKGNKLIIPKSLQREMLDKVHDAHLGIVKSKALAREAIFWPGLSSQLEDMIARCSTCQSVRNSLPSEPLQSQEIPDMPWNKIAIDLFHFKNRDYVLCVDYYSKYPDIAFLPDTTTATVVSAIKTIFARFGIPVEIVSDNGPQFSSREFKQFARKYGFKHTTSSPGYAQSNGQAERHIQTVKKLLYKAEASGGDINLCLLGYRNAPIDGIGLSPAQLLMSRRLNSQLPIKNSLLRPVAVKVKETHKLLKFRQQKQKNCFDRHASKEKRKLEVGENVRFKSLRGRWIPAVVQSPVVGVPRSYNLQTDQQNVLRRNRKHIFPTKESVTLQAPPRNFDPPVPSVSTPGHAHTVNPRIDSPTESHIPRSPPRAIDRQSPITNRSQTRSGRQIKKPVKLDL